MQQSLTLWSFPLSPHTNQVKHLALDTNIVTVMLTDCDRARMCVILVAKGDRYKDSTRAFFCPLEPNRPPFFQKQVVN